jgi:hypothetical protein
MTKFLSYIALITFFISSKPLTSDVKDVNVYVEILGYSPIFKPTLEYNINSFELFGEIQSTYLTLGGSMFGVGYRTSYSSPIIGINHVIGDEYGVEFGASYFRQYRGDFNGDFVEENSMYELDNFKAIGFNVGLREYNDSFFYRINYTPLYNLTDKEFQGAFSFSLGWGF